MVKSGVRIRIIVKMIEKLSLRRFQREMDLTLAFN